MTRRNVRSKERGRGCYASVLLNSLAQIGTGVGLAVLFTLAAAHAEAIAGGESTARRHSSRGTGWRSSQMLAAAGALVAFIVVRKKGAS